MIHVYDNTKIVKGLAPVVLSASSTPVNFIDTIGYNDGMLIVASGAMTATGSDVYTISVLEGDVTSSMTTVSGITLTFGFVSGASEAATTKVARISGLGVTRKRYLQAAMVASATTVSVALDIQFALGIPDAAPVNSGAGV